MPDGPDPALILAPSLLAADFSVGAAAAVDQVSRLAARRHHGQPVRTEPDHRAGRGAGAAGGYRTPVRLPPDDRRSGRGGPSDTPRRARTTSPSTPRRRPTRCALAKDVRAAGARVGLAIDRDTPVEPYLELLPALRPAADHDDQGGLRRPGVPAATCSRRSARPARHRDAGHLELRHRGRRRDRRGHDRARPREAGADTFVAGTAVFAAADPAAAVAPAARTLAPSGGDAARPARRGPAVTLRARTSPRPRILVVDDDVDIARFRRDEPADGGLRRRRRPRRRGRPRRWSPRTSPTWSSST